MHSLYRMQWIADEVQLRNWNARASFIEKKFRHEFLAVWWVLLNMLTSDVHRSNLSVLEKDSEYACNDEANSDCL